MFILKNYNIPIEDKYCLNIDEAVAYFGIGEKKLRYIANEYADSDFILLNGNKCLFKRRKFEDWLDSVSSI